MIWIEVVLAFAVPVGWGVWQLIDLRRERRRDEAKRAETVKPRSVR
ncbi:MAG: hypothetical protein ABI277_06190 [Burkholderiaceae bacterium]